MYDSYGLSPTTIIVVATLVELAEAVRLWRQWIKASRVSSE